MKQNIVLFILLIFGANLFSQQWETDFGKAKELAATEDKPIILVFQGSDWCAPCIKLDREIWSTDEFKSYAQEHFVMFKADFPRRKKNALDDKQRQQNAELAEAYNKNGYFPYVVVLDKSGNVLGSEGYKKVSPEAYIQILESFKS